MEVIEGVHYWDVLSVVGVLGGFYFSWARGDFLLAMMSGLAMSYIILHTSTERHRRFTGD